MGWRGRGAFVAIVVTFRIGNARLRNGGPLGDQAVSVPPGSIRDGHK